MKKNHIIIIEICLLILILFSAYKIFSYHKNNEDFNNSHKVLREDIEKLKTENISNNDEKVNEIAKLKEAYPDLVGWIKIEGTEIDYPIVKGKDNDFYLNHNYKGEYHPFGEVFMDARNASDFSSQNTIIYGHNVRSGHVFHDLEKLKDKDFWEDHKNIEIKTPKGVLNYEIVAIYPAMAEDNYRNPNYSQEEWQTFRTWVKDRNLLNADLPINNDNILTLSTCSDEKDRLAIHAVLK